MRRRIPGQGNIVPLGSMQIGQTLGKELRSPPTAFEFLG